MNDTKLQKSDKIGSTGEQIDVLTDKKEGYVLKKKLLIFVLSALMLAAPGSVYAEEAEVDPAEETVEEFPDEGTLISDYSPETMYADQDEVKVFEKRNKGSKTIKTLKGGDSVLVQEMTTDLKWCGIYVEASEGQKMGWILTEDMAYVMPSRFCSHEWTEWEVLNEATCTDNGMMTRSCPICGVGEAVDIPAEGHSFREWEVTKEADCIHEGERYHVCPKCGYEETEVIPTTDHKFTDWTVTKEATCKDLGERTHKCTVCGLEEKQVIEKVPHKFAEWTVLKQATCTEEGQRSHRCTVCGIEEKENVAKLPHDFEVRIITEATDHSAGVRANVCRKCGLKEKEESFDPEGTVRRGDRSEAVREVQQLLIDQKYLNEGGADGAFGGGTEQALMQFQKDHGLTADGVAWPQTIAKLRHDFAPWSVVTSLTRTQAGELMHICRDCGYEERKAVEPMPSFERGARGEDVRAVQMMLSALGYETGTADGIYGQKLDNSFTEFAKKENTQFTAGKVLPADIDALANVWLASLTEEDWLADGEAPELTVTQVDAVEALRLDPEPAEVPVETEAEEAAESEEAAVESVAEIFSAEEGQTEELTEEASEAEEMETEEVETETEEAETEAEETAAISNVISYNYAIKNHSDKNCTFTAILVSFDENPDFHSNTMVMAIDRQEVQAKDGNIIAGSFDISAGWGANPKFAVLTSVNDGSGEKWMITPAL